jgi:hypothetical protein
MSSCSCIMYVNYTYNGGSCQLARAAFSRKDSGAGDLTPLSPLQGASGGKRAPVGRVKDHSR